MKQFSWGHLAHNLVSLVPVLFRKMWILFKKVGNTREIFAGDIPKYNLHEGNKHFSDGSLGMVQWIHDFWFCGTIPTENFGPRE